jgi:photosystem II stability/assembly factor-like uncharacterized protein
MNRTRSLLFAVGTLMQLTALTLRPAASQESWVSVGPHGTPLDNHDVISGEVRAIAVHPRDAQILYIGAAEGGVWKTSDGGAHWTPLTDFHLVRRLPSGAEKGTLSIGSLTVDPERPDTVYAGTGDLTPACCFPGPGLGVFRSTNGGLDWTPMGADLSRTGCDNGAVSQAVVSRIVVRPGSPTAIFAATNVGLFRYLEDGSDCWKRLTEGLPTSGIVIDLVRDALQGTLYTAIWGQGIYKTTDPANERWVKLTAGLPPSGFGRISLAISRPQQAEALYAGFDANGRYRLFKSTNRGDTWSERPSPPSEAQLNFGNALAVGLNGSNTVYVGQVALWRANDGGERGGLNDYSRDPPIVGNSWTNLSCCLPDRNFNRRGLDLHADIHDIVVAPRGSFPESTAAAEILYVANDGGVTKGVVNDVGVVTWLSLTRGLTIGQCGTIGLAPGSPDLVTCGLWHNGTILMDVGADVSVPVGGGDGFQATIDAGGGPSTVVHFNCNAGFGGSLCRATTAPHLLSIARVETLWPDNGGAAHWSDPYRPGHLLRLDLASGKLFRTQHADTQSAIELNRPDAWQLIEPPGKSGKTTTVAFRRKRAFDSPLVYYVGTDTGQVWRGSPEVGWRRLCDCGAPVNAVATDLILDDRLVVVFGGPSRSGRIKELWRQPNDTWDISDIDAGFNPALRVDAITSVVIDPLGTGWVFVGTDQGVYRGQRENGQWIWTRSPGVPNVWVTDLEAHDSSVFVRPTGVVRAGTYGRGVFELQGGGPR